MFAGEVRETSPAVHLVVGARSSLGRARGHCRFVGNEDPDILLLCLVIRGPSGLWERKPNSAIVGLLVVTVQSGSRPPINERRIEFNIYSNPTLYDAVIS